MHKKALNSFLAVMLTVLALMVLSAGTALAAGATVTGSNFTYTVNSDGTSCTLTGYSGSGSSVVIPDKMDEYTVTDLGERLFYGHTELTTVSFSGNGLLVIGDYAFYGCTGLSSVTLPETVTAINYYAFYRCTSLKQIDLPQSISNIGYCAFACSGLTSAEFRSNIRYESQDMWAYGHAYEGCEGITSVTLDSSWTKIPDSLFAGMTGLKTVTLPDTVKTIETSAFGNCSSLTSVNLPYGLKTLDGAVFAGCSSLKEITIPEGITGWGSSLFSSCSSLETVHLPSTLQYLTDSSFSYCTSLSSIDFSNTALKEIGGSVFYDCKSMESLTLPSTLKTISSYAFNNMTALKRIVIPAGVTRIGEYYEYDSSWRFYLFIGCDNLEEILVENGNTGYASENGILYNADKTILIACPAKVNMTSLVIPNTVTTIAEYAFSGNTTLQSVTISAGVTSELNNNTLPAAATALYVDSANPVYASADGMIYSKDMKKLAAMPAGYQGSYTIPEGVEYIYAAACSGCSGLTAITVPEGVTSIQYSTFTGCTALAEIHLPYTLKTIATSAFTSCSALTDVYYNGELDDWNNISIGDWGNDYLTAAKLHTTDDLGDPVATGEVNGSYSGGTWEFYEDGTLVIKGRGEAYSLLSIGSYQQQVKKVKVSKGITGIGWTLLRYLSNVEEISLPDGVESLLDSSLNLSAKLKILRLPATLVSIGDNVFYNDFAVLDDVYYAGTVTQWNSVSIGSGNDSLTSRTTIHCSDGDVDYPYGGTCGPDAQWSMTDGTLTITGTGSVNSEAFFNNNDVVHVIVSEGIESIGNYAFAGCSGLESVSFPDSLTTLGEGVFHRCPQLTSLTIPAGVTSVSFPLVFASESFTEYLVAEGNTAFAAADGVLFTADMKKLVSYPCAKNTNQYTVPSSVEVIGSNAFISSSATKEVVLPSGLKSFENGAFSGCTGLIKITVPAGITAIPDNCFYECVFLKELTLSPGIAAFGNNAFFRTKALSDIYYDGTVAQWAADGLTADDLSSTVTVHCQDGDMILGVSLNWTDENTAETAGSGPVCEEMATGYSRLRKLIIHEDVTGIKSSAFAYCSNLTAVQLPVSLAYIDRNAFANDSVLRHVYYAGTAEQWNGISIAEGNDSLLNAQIHYESAMPEGADVYTYTLIDGGAAITGYSGSASFLEIPEEIDGIPVIQISERAFAENMGITRVTIPEGVLRIEGWAFAGCSALEEINLPDSLSYVGDNAFIWDAGLTHVTIPAGLRMIGDNPFNDCQGMQSYTVAGANTAFCAKDGVLFTKDMKTLIDFPSGRTGTYTVPDGVQVIGMCAFRSSRITSVSLPDSVKTLKRMAFHSSRNLTSFTLPAGVETIEDEALHFNIDAYNVAKANTHFTAVDGVIYTKDKKVLVQYPIRKQASSFTVPEGVTGIGNYALSQCLNLRTIILPSTLTDVGMEAFSYNEFITFEIPEGVAELGPCAFWCCRSLAEIHLPSTLTKIKEGCFGNTALTDIWFNGTQEQWDSVVILPGDYNQEAIDNAKIHFRVDYKTYKLPASLTVVSAEAFSGLHLSALEVMIQEGCTSIGEQAFFEAADILCVHVPVSVNDIAVNAFDGCEEVIFVIPAGESYARTYAVNHAFTIKTAD